MRTILVISFVLLSNCAQYDYCTRHGICVAGAPCSKSEMTEIVDHYLDYCPIGSWDLQFVRVEWRNGPWECEFGVCHGLHTGGDIIATDVYSLYHELTHVKIEIDTGRVDRHVKGDRSFDHIWACQHAAWRDYEQTRGRT